MNKIILKLENHKFLTLMDSDFISIFINYPFYKLRFKRYVSSVTDNTLILKEELNYLKIRQIIQVLKSECDKRDIELIIDASLLLYLQQKEFHIDSRYRIGNEIKAQDSKYEQLFNEYSIILTDTMSRKLRDKQLWDSFYMSVMKKSCNFSVPGSGKTSSVLGVYAYLKYKGLVNKIVMIGPKNSFGSWIDEFEICFKGKESLNYFNIHDNRFGSKQQKTNFLKYDSGNINLFLFNYESLRGYKEGIEQIIDQKCLLVFDEVHKIKSIVGKNAQHALEVSKNASYIIALTGTPIPNSYTDIYNLLHILYADEYDDFFGFRTQMLKNPKSHEIEEINNKIRPFFCRTTKEQLNVPKANEDKICYISPTKTENRLFYILYQKYKKDKLTMLIRMLQFESNPKLLLNDLDLNDFKYILDDSIEEVHNIDYVDYSQELVQLIKSIRISSKMEYCINLVKQLVQEGKTIIIWCIFVDTMTHLERLLQQLGISVRLINGSVELEERHEIIDSFKSGQLNVLITNPHTLAESVSLHQVCHDAIYFEYSYNLVHLLQSKDRIHRLGLAEGQYTQYYYLMNNYELEGETFSLDEQIYNRLCDKERIMLDAIDHHILEHVTSDEEDLTYIFESLSEFIK